MTIVSAAVITFFLLLISQMVSVALHFPFTLILIPSTALWATSEATRLRRRILSDEASAQDHDITALLQTTRPMVVFTACLVFWLFGFPWYLLMRGKLVAAANKK